MSHFTVLVIGDNVDGALAPFHEFECTGEDNEFVQNVDMLAEVLEDFERMKNSEDGYKSAIEVATDYHGLDLVEDDAEPDLASAHKYGWARVRDGQLVEAVRRTNPNKKWDWYVVGGRWSGFFKLKHEAVMRGGVGSLGRPGTFETLMEPEERAALLVERITENRADQALKGDIDFETMRNEAGDRAAALYDKVHALVDGLEFISWTRMRDEIHAGNIEAARKAYHQQAPLRALATSGDDELRWLGFNGLEPFFVPREQYVQSARDGAISTFAVLKDGVWYEKGDMGWWGMVSNEKDRDEWLREYATLLDSLPDDTLLTVVDCHI